MDAHACVFERAEYKAKGRQIPMKILILHSMAKNMTGIKQKALFTAIFANFVRELISMTLWTTSSIVIRQ